MNDLTRRNVTLGGLAAAATAPLRSGRTQDVSTLKIGCPTDRSGPYKDLAGPGAVAAAHRAVRGGFAAKGFNDRARAFSDRFTANMPGIRPTMVQAGVHSSSLHYLKTATEMGVAQAKQDGAATVARMKAMPTEDDCFGKESIRVDGHCIHPSYPWEVKQPSESKGPWDYYKPVASTPADKAFRPLDKGGCSLVKA